MIGSIPGNRGNGDTGPGRSGSEPNGISESSRIRSTGRHWAESVGPPKSGTGYNPPLPVKNNDGIG